MTGGLQPMPGAPGSKLLDPIDAIMAAYRAHITLASAELDCLTHAMTALWVVLGSWMHLIQDAPLREVAAGNDDAELTASFPEERPPGNPAQPSLF